MILVDCLPLECKRYIAGEISLKCRDFLSMNPTDAEIEKFVSDLELNSSFMGTVLGLQKIPKEKVKSYSKTQTLPEDFEWGSPYPIAIGGIMYETDIHAVYGELVSKAAGDKFKKGTNKALLKVLGQSEISGLTVFNHAIKILGLSEDKCLEVAYNIHLLKLEQYPDLKSKLDNLKSKNIYLESKSDFLSRIINNC